MSKSYKKKQRLRSKADKLWYEHNLKLQCEVCGKRATQVHHFFPKGLYGHLRYEDDNGISLCQGCHFALHFKSDPSIQQQIIKKRGMKWYNKLLKKSQKRPEGSYLTLKYYQDIIKKYET